MKKKLYRSRTHRIVAGVCGGIAEYFGINPKYIRIGYLIFTLICSISIRFSFLPYGIYLILVLAIPNNPNEENQSFSSIFNRQQSRPSRRTSASRKVIRDVKEKDIKK